jgi:hypothetical protein
MGIYRKNPKMDVGLMTDINSATLSHCVAKKADNASDIAMSIETVRCQEILI